MNQSASLKSKSLRSNGTVLEDSLSLDGGFRKKLTQSAANSSSLYDSSIENDTKLSLNSLYRHYINREYWNLDIFDGFLDMNLVKHVRLGCLDAQTFSQLQMVAKKYCIYQLDQSNVISIIYGSTFSENRFNLTIDPKIVLKKDPNLNGLFKGRYLSLAPKSVQKAVLTHWSLSTTTCKNKSKCLISESSGSRTCICPCSMTIEDIKAVRQWKRSSYA